VFDNPVLAEILSLGRPEHMAFVVAALLLFGGVYITWGGQQRSKYLGLAVGVFGAGASIGVWLGIISYFNRVSSTVFQPGVPLQHLDEGTWLTSLVLEFIAVVFGLFCLAINAYDNPARRKTAVWFGVIALASGATSLAAGCTVMYLTNNASALKVTVLYIWQWSTVIAVISMLISLIATPFAFKENRQLRREADEEAAKRAAQSAHYGGLMNQKLHGDGQD
jgi:hypothetical protein